MRTGTDAASGPAVVQPRQILLTLPIFLRFRCEIEKFIFLQIFFFTTFCLFYLFDAHISFFMVYFLAQKFKTKIKTAQEFNIYNVSRNSEALWTHCK